MWVQICETHRVYGGPQEGGWWYDRTYVTWAKKVKKRHAKKLLKQIKGQIIPNRYDRFSVLGGGDTWACITRRAMEMDSGGMRYE